MSGLPVTVSLHAVSRAPLNMALARMKPFAINAAFQIAVAFVGLVAAVGAFAASEPPEALGAEKSGEVRPEKPGTVAGILPQKGIVVAATGAMSCCAAVIIDLEKRTLVTGGARGRSETYTTRPLPNEKVFNLIIADVAEIIAEANGLWRAPTRWWGEKCGGGPCPPYLDYIAEIWLVDGDTYRFETAMTPIDKNGAFGQLHDFITDLAYKKHPQGQTPE